MPRIIDIMKRKMLVLGFALALAPLIAGWLAADQLAHPPRRPLQDFHNEFIADPRAHGVILRPFACSDGTPCLLCEPDAKAPPGRRGKLIREQLAAKGVPLQTYGEIVGTLVLVHGRRGRKEDYLPIAERFCAAGFRCVIPDLPAHGDHPAKIAAYGVREGGLPEMVLHESAKRFSFDPEPSGIMGLSMGGAVSVQSCAREHAPWKAVVLVSTFDALPNVVRHQSANLVGEWAGGLLAKITGWMFRQATGFPLENADSKAAVPLIRCPVLMAHGMSDRVIPIALGRNLRDALPAGITTDWIEIPDADHDDVLITDFPIYAKMAEWMLRHVAEPGRN
ncbi:MAG: alpha/beta hydrolase [Prosthecobacter sp.]